MQGRLCKCLKLCYVLALLVRGEPGIGRKASCCFHMPQIPCKLMQRHVQQLAALSA